MRVAVVAVGQMRVRVAHGRVHMPMAVAGVGCDGRVVRVGMVFVVDMTMFVRDFAMRMVVFVAFA